jgi:hypothetical protein
VLETMGAAHHLHTLILPSLSLSFSLSLSLYIYTHTHELIAQARPHLGAHHAAPPPPRASPLWAL